MDQKLWHAPLEGPHVWGMPRIVEERNIKRIASNTERSLHSLYHGAWLPAYEPITANPTAGLEQPANYKTVAVIGLGIDSLADYATPGSTLTFM